MTNKLTNGQILDEVIKSIRDNPSSSEEEKTVARFMLASKENQFAFLKVASLLMVLFPQMFLNMVVVVEEAFGSLLPYFRGRENN